jgi:hypothetical protein
MAELRGYLILLLAGYTSGISLYLTIALLGIAGNAGWVNLPPGLEILQHPLVIAAAILVYVVEFLADKVPYVDSVWDWVHTVIRPVGAGTLGFLAGTDIGPAAQAAFAVLTGSIALDSHAMKSSTRMVINTSPEPFSNIAASIAEHSFVIFLFWFFIQNPILACGLIILILVASFFILRALWRFVIKIFRRPQKPAPEPLKVDLPPRQI